MFHIYLASTDDNVGSEEKETLILSNVVNKEETLKYTFLQLAKSYIFHTKYVCSKIKKKPPAVLKSQQPSLALLSLETRFLCLQPETFGKEKKN